MGIDKNKIEKDFLNALKDAYLTYDCDHLVDLLAVDLTYSSFWVFGSIDSADEYLDYLEGKLMTQRRTNYKADFCLVKHINSHKPLLLVAPRGPEGDFGCFIAECNDEGLICKLDIMPSSFYRWEAEEMEELERFITRN